MDFGIQLFRIKRDYCYHKIGFTDNVNPIQSAFVQTALRFPETSLKSVSEDILLSEKSLKGLPVKEDEGDSDAK